MTDIDFYCPKCGEYTKAELVDGFIYSDPFSPSLKCNVCETYWRIEVYDVGKEDDKKYGKIKS